MKLSLLSAGLSCGLVALLSCCKGPGEGDAAGQAGNRQWGGHFASVDWVSKNLGQLRLIDVRSRAEYERGHLPGAVSLPAALWHEDLVGRGDRMVPAGRLERFLSEAGVVPTDLVVVYGEGGDYGAIRAAWVLDAHGHQHVAVMPDGMRGWSDRGGSMTSEAPGLDPSTYRARLRGERVANKLSVIHAISNPAVVLLDVRRGNHERTRRIPTSRSVGLDDAALRPANLAEVRELQAGLKGVVPEGQQCIVYSDNGMRASLVSLVLRDAGVSAAVYDGGWNEWASHSGLPIENLAEPAPEESPVTPVTQPAISP